MIRSGVERQVGQHDVAHRRHPGRPAGQEEHVAVIGADDVAQILQHAEGDRADGPRHLGRVHHELDRVQVEAVGTGLPRGACQMLPCRGRDRLPGQQLGQPEAACGLRPARVHLLVEADQRHCDRHQELVRQQGPQGLLLLCLTHPVAAEEVGQRMLRLRHACGRESPRKTGQDDVLDHHLDDVIARLAEALAEELLRVDGLLVPAADSDAR